jgi:hypothetical protein
MFSDFNNEPVTYSFLGFGDMVTSNTVNKMIDTIKVSSKNLRVRNKAAEIVSGLRAKDQWNEVDTVYWWVKNNTRYLKDPHGTELLHSPLVVLDQIDAGYKFQGDCDDLSVFVLSLLKSIGYPVALRIAAYKKDGNFQHVYGLVSIYGQWIPIEPIEKSAMLGWEAPGATKVRDYKI